MKLKTLLSSLKERKRYVVFEIISEKQLDNSSVSNAIKTNALKFMGELNFGKAGIKILKDKFTNNRGIIKVTHKYVDYLKASLTLTEKINAQDVIIRSLGVSGILKKACSKFMQV